MNSFITLERGSPDFDAYLLGTFSKTHRALPVKSLNVNSAQERVTFQIVPLDQIQIPSFFQVWLKALRLRSFLFVLFPMFWVLAKNVADSHVKDPWSLLSATFSVLFLFSAFNLRNDFVDHMKGFDRMDSMLGRRPIQSGWLTADLVRRVANIFLWVAVLLVFPVFIAFPHVMLFAMTTAVVGYLTLFQSRISFKEKRGAELGLWLLMGPLLTCGYEVSLTGWVSKETFWFGAIWGWMGLLNLHLRHLELILVQSQAGVQNFVNLLGFDRAKRFIYYWWFVGVVGFVGYHFTYAGFFWFWFLSLVVIFISFRFSQKLLALSSPLGSELVALRRRGSYMVDIVLGLWLLETLWYLFL